MPPRGTPKKVVVVAVHHISWATARAGPSKHVGGLMGTVDVVVVVIVAVAHHVSWAAVRAGSSKHMDRLMGRAERPIRIEPTSHGPRPGPAHQISRGWAAARPSPSYFQLFPARPGPSRFQKSRPGPTQPVTIFRSVRPGPAKTNGP